jgi:hypothetical protein
MSLAPSRRDADSHNLHILYPVDEQARPSPQMFWDPFQVAWLVQVSSPVLSTMLLVAAETDFASEVVWARHQSERRRP